MCINISGLFTDLGITSGVMHIQNISKKEYSSLFWLNIFSGVIVFALFWACTPLIVAYYKEDQLAEILPIIFTVILITSFYRLQRTVQLKQMNFRFIALSDITGSVIMLMMSVVLAVSGFGIYSLVFSTICYYLWLALIYFVNALKNERNIFFHFSFKETRPFLKIGVYQLGASVIDTISSEMDTIIIGRAFSMEVLGVYTLCKQFAVRIYQFINPIITNVLTPVLAKVQFDLVEVKNKYLKTITIIALVNIPIYLFISYLSPEVLSVLYGRQYEDAYWVMIILCLNYALLSTGNPGGSLQVALGRTDLGFYWTIYRVVANALALLVGALTGRLEYCVLSVLLVNIINLYPGYKMITKKIIPLKFSEQLSIFILPLLLCASLFIVNFVHLIGIPYIIRIVLAGVIFFPLYALLSFKFSPTAKETADRVLIKIRRK